MKKNEREESNENKCSQTGVQAVEIKINAAKQLRQPLSAVGTSLKAQIAHLLKDDCDDDDGDDDNDDDDAYVDDCDDDDCNHVDEGQCG